MGSSVENRNPFIKRLLNNYRISSENSLSGPTELKLENHLGASTRNLTVRFENDKWKKELKNEDGFVQRATFMTMDNSFDGLSSTELEGESIACFEIGGENRLCLAQIIKSILSSFTLPEIHAVFESFHIFSAICSPTQLQCLKEKKILPASAPKCGLVTKSDAQRFCSVLLRGGNLLTDKKQPISKEPFRRKRLSFVYEHGNVNKSDCFGVAHKCFGGCRGTFVQKLYRSSRSACIQCDECQMLFSPEKFVSHFHSIAEYKQTCHWGFDSSNWRHYLELDARELPEHQKTLLGIKETINSNCSPKLEPKEKTSRRVCAQPPSNTLLKHSKCSLPFDGSQQEPPALLHPVTSCRADMEAFAPNVSLLPLGRVNDRGKGQPWKEALQEKFITYDDDEEDDDDYDDYREDDDDDDDDELSYHERRSRVLSSITDEDVETIRQLDEIQEAELKLFRLALKDEISETEKSSILNEFGSIQKKLQTLLEGLVTKNKELVQKCNDLSDEKQKKDLPLPEILSKNLGETRLNLRDVRPHRPHKKRHCQTASPVLCPMKESKFSRTAPQSDSDGDESNEDHTNTMVLAQRPPKRKRCNTYSSARQTTIKMELF